MPEPRWPPEDRGGQGTQEHSGVTHTVKHTAVREGRPMEQWARQRNVPEVVNASDEVVDANAEVVDASTEVAEVAVEVVCACESPCD